MQYINLGSYVTVPAGVTLDNSPIAMQGEQALSVKSSQQRSSHLHVSLCKQFTFLVCFIYRHSAI